MQTASRSSIDEPISLLLNDKSALIQELKNDVLVQSHYKHGEEQTLSTNELLKKEGQFSKKLQDLHSVRSIPGLLMEVETNLELLELENCYYSLKTLRRKLNDNAAIINNSFGLQQSIARYVDNLHLKLVDMIYQLCFQGFWKMDNESITFSKTIKWGKEQLEIEYSSFIESVERLFCPDGLLDSKLWIISDMIFGDLQETVRNRLNTIANDYVQLNFITERIKNALFTVTEQVYLSNGGETLAFKFCTPNSDESANETVASFDNILQFMQKSLISRDRAIFIEKLGNILANELLKFIKANAFIILQSEDCFLKEKITAVNGELQQLYKIEGGKYDLKTSEIERLLGSSELHTNLKLEKIFQDHLAEMRTFFNSEGWKVAKELDSRRIPERTGVHKSSENRSSESSKFSKSDETDDWGWEADDGWDDQVEINLDDDNGSQLSRKSIINEHNADFDDEWNEAWDVDIDTNDERKSLTSIDTQYVVKVTQLPQKFIRLINDFEKKYKELCNGSLSEQYYHHKLNLLQTSYMAMSTCHFKDDWWQLFNDLYYIVETNKSFTRLHELGINFLDFNLKTRQMICDRLISDQLNEFMKHEVDPSWDVTITDFLPLIHKDIIGSFSLISHKIAQEYIMKFLRFLYNDCILERILNWKIISEKNSENLSELIGLVCAKTEVPILCPNQSYQELREKFAITGKFLPLHLKDIMEMFYHGDFYLFDTDEIIQWIVLLFAETPLRKDAIDDIREIRNVQIED